MTFTFREAAERAASRLHVWSTVAIALVSLFTLLGLGAGIVIAINAHTSEGRLTGVLTAIGSMLSWIFSIVPYLGAQAIARYIDFRIFTDDQGITVDDYTDR